MQIQKRPGANFYMPLLAAIFTGMVISAAADTNLTFTAEQLRLPGKRGACLTLRDPATRNRGTWDENLPKLARIQPYWNYSWGAYWVPQQTNYINSEFIPMIWGRRRNLQEVLDREIVPLIENGTVKRVLGFNEPDKENQANMTYMEAIEAWPALTALGVPLVSPAPANPVGRADPSDQGVRGTWMRDFMREVEERNYRVDYIGVHWYGGTNVESFKNRMRLIYEMYGERPLLITEFSTANWHTDGDFTRNRHTPARVMAFAKEVLPWIEEQDWILGYAWYSFRIHEPQGYTSSLFFEDGSLTALGRYYASITNENPQGDQSIEPDDAEAFLARAQAARKRWEEKNK